MPPDPGGPVHPFMRNWATEFAPSVDVDEITRQWASGQDSRARTETAPDTKESLKSWADAIAAEHSKSWPGPVWTPAARRGFVAMVEGMFPPDDHG